MSCRHHAAACSRQRKVHNAVSSRPYSSKNPRLFVDYLKKVVFRRYGLTAAEEKCSTVAQPKVEEVQNPVLHFRFEINKKVSAGRNVETGEWRILQNVLRCEHHFFSDVLPNTIQAIFLLKEVIEAGGGYIGLDAAGVKAVPGIQ